MKFPDEASARVALYEIRAKGRWHPRDLKRLRAYKCPHCEYWHVGKLAPDQRISHQPDYATQLEMPLQNSNSTTS